LAGGIFGGEHHYPPRLPYCLLGAQRMSVLRTRTMQISHEQAGTTTAPVTPPAVCPSAPPSVLLSDPPPFLSDPSRLVRSL
jgi:hypothetical protein